MVVSSSPDLPSLREILLQKPRRPLLRGGSSAAPIPDNATATFTSAGSLLRSLQSNDAVTQKLNSCIATPDAEKEVDALVEDSVVELPTGRDPKACKPRPRKKAVPKCPEVIPEHAACSVSLAKDQSWKMFKSPTKATNDEPVEPGPVKETGLVSSHFFKSPVPQKPAKAKATKEEMNEPLHLEPAMSRRMDWTPAQKTRIVLDSDPPGPKDWRCSQGKGPAEPFETILASFKCNETLQQEAMTISEEDSAFLKKRKLIELAPTKAANAPEPPKPVKSSAKQKVPKKKARTITRLATAAYRSPTQTDSDAALGNETRETEAAKPTESGKRKPWKRAPKASKKPLPPKPILLSQGAALRQVAHQDFVFDTSSQLAREQSPSLLLRNLQMAVRDSNWLDHVEFTTPVNSDAIEPPERRQTLWDAGARDADGDLFDVEVCSFPDGSPRLAGPATEADPFRYVRGDGDAMALPDLRPDHGPQDDDSFINLSDILPAPGREAAETVDDGSQFSESELSAGTVSRRDVVSTCGEGRDGIPPVDCDRDGKQASPGPSYELYSDAQLAKQVAQYGFKPIKKRTAMIALLEKCRQESARTGQGQTRPASTLAAGASKRAAGPGASAAAAGKEKRGRGRPRKHAGVEVTETHEPPPSAQASESPKRPRGRPRKEAAASPPRTGTAAQVKKVSSRAATGQAPTTPEGKGKAKASRRAVEIAGSESDGGADLSSACSSLDATFLPPPAIDLSLSVDEDTELSLAVSPTGQQSVLFAHMTKAVMTAPRMSDPEDSSWHEKMLYDPIVLEDLTAWLNSGQLRRVGYEGEASVGEVKR